MFVINVSLKGIVKGEIYTSGDHCEVNVNECLRSPCENQGNCVDVIGSFTCLCQDGYTGEVIT